MSFLLYNAVTQREGYSPAQRLLSFEGAFKVNPSMASFSSLAVFTLCVKRLPLENLATNSYTMAMKKDKAILLILVAFLAGFIIGAISGIKFYAAQRGETAAVPHEHEGGPPPGPQAKQNLTQEIAQLEDLLKRDPNNLQALVSLGNAYFDTNQYNKAIDVYQRALKVDPKNADVRTDLGIMYRSIKDYDSAVREFRQAAKDNPTHINSRFNLAIVLQSDKKDIPGAISAWEDFLKVEPAGQRAGMAQAQLEQLKSLAK
jgi:cytochrome c-type biogenesis protein CcmH/NrfG